MFAYFRSVISSCADILKYIYLCIYNENVYKSDYVFNREELNIWCIFLLIFSFGFQCLKLCRYHHIKTQKKKLGTRVCHTYMCMYEYRGILILYVPCQSSNILVHGYFIFTKSLAVYMYIIYGPFLYIYRYLCILFYTYFLRTCITFDICVDVQFCRRVVVSE